MVKAIYAFYRDQTSERVGKCVDVVVPFSSAEKKFLRSHFQPEESTCFSIETAAASGSAFGYMSECSLVHTEQSQSCTTSEFVRIQSQLTKIEKSEATLLE